MRIHFTNEIRPKSTAKALRLAVEAEGASIKLSAAQEAVARLYGYRDWKELSSLIGKGPQSAMDGDPAVGADVALIREDYQTEALTRFLGFDPERARRIVKAVGPTAAPGSQRPARARSGIESFYADNPAFRHCLIDKGYMEDIHDSDDEWPRAELQRHLHGAIERCPGQWDVALASACLYGRMPEAVNVARARQVLDLANAHPDECDSRFFLFAAQFLVEQTEFPMPQGESEFEDAGQAVYNLHDIGNELAFDLSRGSSAAAFPGTWQGFRDITLHMMNSHDFITTLGTFLAAGRIGTGPGMRKRLEHIHNEADEAAFWVIDEIFSVNDVSHVIEAFDKVRKASSIADLITDEDVTDDVRLAQAVKQGVTTFAGILRDHFEVNSIDSRDHLLGLFAGCDEAIGLVEEVMAEHDRQPTNAV